MSDNDSLWGSAESGWQSLAECSGTNPEVFFPVTESPATLEVVQERYCSRCPVQTNCLNFALINGDSGYWGGTDSAQRRAMSRTRRRAKCPVCSNDGLIKTDDHQVCIKCGVSWKSDEDRPAVAVESGAEQ
jgi:transcription factor WhiB/A2L zinc ribbon protein